MAAEKWIERLRSVTEPHCDGPVLVAAIVQPFGRQGAQMLTAFSPLAGLLKQRRIDGQSALPKNSLIAVTARRIHVFEARPAGLGYRVVREACSWDRDEVEVTIEELKTVYAIAVADRSSDELLVMEALKKPLLGYRGVATELVRTLSGAS